MDVDLLRPGTVPISPDTLLWFEFLLDPSLLRKHLEKPTADPSPFELIVKFLTESAVDLAPTFVPPNSTNGAQTKASRRSQALKILALKVTAFLNWDLDTLENKLPINLQADLLKDLLLFVSEKHSDPNTHKDLDFTDLPPQTLFAISLYHRWIIRTFANSTLNAKQLKNNGLLQVVPIPEGIVGIEISELESERSMQLLKKLVTTKNPQTLVVPSFESLVPLAEDPTDVDHRWDLCRVVSTAQFHCQVLMDISNYLIFRERYPYARGSLKACLNEFHAWKQEGAGKKDDVPYCTVTQNLISGCCMAFGIRPSHYNPSLTQQFHKSVSDQYIDIGRILEKDNIKKEIPMLYRDSLELDIVSEAASGKLTAHRDGIQQIHAANMVRRALEGAAWHKFKVTPVALNKALVAVLPASEIERERLQYFLLELLALCDAPFVRELCEQPSVKQLLTDAEIHDVQENDYTDPIPQALMSNEIEASPIVKNVTSEAAAVERLLISSYDPQEIKSAIIKLVSNCPVLDMVKINRAWEMPLPIFNILMSSLRGTIQHYVYALVSKSYELDHMKNYGLARTMLRVACDEINREYGTNNMSMPIVQVLSWEILLVDIHQFHIEWPAKHIDWSGLGRECTNVLHMTDVCRPRIAVYERCALTLLNMGQWQSLINAPLPPPRHSVPVAEFYTSIATACLDINQYNKKISTEAWDKLLPVFLSSQKRRDSLTSATTSVCSVVEVNALAVVVSLLAKLYNILNNQPDLDLFVHFTPMWPTSLKNSNQYSIKYVAEMLYEVLNHALKLYPHNVAWLKLFGDLNFANSHFSTALKYYLEAAIAGTDYFARPISRNIIEDHIYKRMIKCCTQLQCHTQAAVLCQFLEDVDYTVAFKSLAEASCSDAMDSYYDCIWDVTILEYLINLHSKRGEHYRKQKVVRIIGLLELNANNNEEIRREAENIRKAKFLRAMAKQYIC